MNVELPSRIAAQLHKMAESGMGYQVIRVTTKTGEVFDGVVVVESHLIASVARTKEVPFDPEDITSFELTHDRSAVIR